MFPISQRIRHMLENGVVERGLLTCEGGSGFVTGGMGIVLPWLLPSQVEEGGGIPLR